MSGSRSNCQPERIAAYVDGDLDAAEVNALEGHLLECKACSEELHAQLVFLRELDANLPLDPEPPIPSNFAQIVAINAESDMRGVRDPREHRRALRYCLILAFAAFALLGATASRSLLVSGRLVVGRVLGVLGLLWKTAYDAVAGLLVISRVVGGRFLSGSQFAGMLALLLLLAVLLLSILISRYHRHRPERLVE